MGLLSTFQIYRATRTSYAVFYDLTDGFEVLRVNTGTDESVSYVEKRLYITLPDYFTWDTQHSVLLDEGITTTSTRRNIFVTIYH